MVNLKEHFQAGDIVDGTITEHTGWADAFDCDFQFCLLRLDHGPEIEITLPVGLAGRPDIGSRIVGRAGYPVFKNAPNDAGRYNGKSLVDGTSGGIVIVCNHKIVLPPELPEPSLASRAMTAISKVFG